MAIKLLPDPWKLWHPIVFGILFSIGAAMTGPLINFVLSLVRTAAQQVG